MTTEKTTEKTTEIDTFNNFMVAGQGDGLRIMNPPRGIISRLDAMRLAAFLAIMAEPMAGITFDEVLRKMRGSA